MTVAIAERVRLQYRDHPDHGLLLTCEWLLALWHGLVKDAVTPAMAAGLTDKLMSMEDVAEMIDAASAKPDRPKVYRKRVPQISN
jgi:hypothetical protein